MLQISSNTGGGREGAGGRVGAPAQPDHFFYHSFKTHAAAVIRAIDSCNAIVMELRNFLRQNGTATAAKYFDMAAATVIQQVFHVFKKLHMAALVTRNCNAMRVFF